MSIPVTNKAQTPTRLTPLHKRKDGGLPLVVRFARMPRFGDDRAEGLAYNADSGASPHGVGLRRDLIVLTGSLATRADRDSTCDESNDR